MKKIFYSLLSMTCVLLSSCNNDLEEKQIENANEIKTNAEQSIGILSFDNEASFREAVEKMRNNMDEYDFYKNLVKERLPW